LSHPATQTSQNQWIDIHFQSTTPYQNPFNEVELDLTFTYPTGKTITIPAFWQGGDNWCARISSNEIGEHHWVTHCSDENNTGLHALMGNVHVTKDASQNPLMQHGCVRVADDQRHFAYQDGTPFFWLGDTWWMGLTKRLAWPSEFQALTQNRHALGFNVVQIVAGLYPDMGAFDERGLSESGFAWTLDFTNINPAFFDEADLRIQYLVSQGITPCILGCWGYYLEWMGVEKMKRHWRYIMARWGALPVIWTASGEQTMPWYLHAVSDREHVIQALKNDWTEVIRYIHSLNGFKRLITTHPMTSARESVNDPHLLDFEMQQTGHGNHTQVHANMALVGWQTKPIMPVISAESRYEALQITPPVQSADVRQAFWAHLLNSGVAGHTYGANGIWQVNSPNKPFGNSPNGHNWGSLSWQAAMELPVAKQLSIATMFLSRLPWNQLQSASLARQRTPAQKWIASIRHPRLQRIINRMLPLIHIQTPIAAAKTSDEQLAIFYTITDKAFKVNLNGFKSSVIAYWFDPTNGDQHIINNIKKTFNYATFKPIGKNQVGDDDWLLVIQAN
jgi:hypothetical protein